MKALLVAAAVLALTLSGASQARGEPTLIGSKRFTESYVLGEVAKRALENAGLSAEHRQGMGGTIVLWEALRGGAIAAYPDYTGTIREEILKRPDDDLSLDTLRAALAVHGVGLTDELGFNNTYALVMKRERAGALGIRTISDLARHRALAFGLTHEFINRQDGWRPLRRHYVLPADKVRGIEHSLGYVALERGEVDVKDAYSTDAKIVENDLVVLEDDRRFFPEYKAVFLYRLDGDERAIEVLRGLAGTIDERRMIRMNAEAEHTKDYAAAAALYFQAQGGEPGRHVSASLARNILRWTGRHLVLVGLSLAGAIVVGIPLGIRASRPGLLSQAILGAAGLVQTIPALALLALLVPLPFLGISPLTAIVALFLYSLLPIVRNTAAGLQGIPVPLRESAVALGLRPRSQLLKVYLPMASPLILAGIKTSAIINVGSATLAALIGAGGLGEPIISGLNLNDHATILQGAIPAAVLAVLIQALFAGLDRLLIPRGLRLKPR